MIGNNNKVCQVFKALFLKFLKKFFDSIVNTFYSIVHLKEKDVIIVSKKCNTCQLINIQVISKITGVKKDYKKIIL